MVGWLIDWWIVGVLTWLIGIDWSIGIVEIGIFADKKVIIPFYFFHLANLCIFFSKFIFYAQSCKLCRQFFKISGFFAKISKYAAFCIPFRPNSAMCSWIMQFRFIPIFHFLHFNFVYSMFSVMMRIWHILHFMHKLRNYAVAVVVISW